MSDIHPQLITRIEKLEADNRRLRRNGRIVLALGAMGLAMSMAAPRVCKTVWGERFVLKDGRMRERMVLDAYSTAQPSLTFKDREGSPMARMGLDEDGSMTLQVFQAGQPTNAQFQLVPQEESETCSEKGKKSVD